MVAESFRAVAFGKIDPQRKSSSFEIFGFDFMIDEDFTVYLIEANTNPCLETNCSLLSRLIPGMLDSSFSIAVDPLLPPPDLNFKRAHEALHENKYSLIFDETIEGETLKNLSMSLREPSSIGSKLNDQSFIFSDLIGEQIWTGEKTANKVDPSQANSLLDSSVMSRSPHPQRGHKPFTQGNGSNPVKARRANVPYKNEDDFMDVDVRSNIYSSMNDLEGEDPELYELTTNTEECILNTQSKLETTKPWPGSAMHQVTLPNRRKTPPLASNLQLPPGF